MADGDNTNDGNNHYEGPMDDPMRAGIHSLWQQDLFIDYKIKVENREFRVHKLAMSSMSDYFKAMLSGDLAEGKQDSVVIKGVGLSADVMEILIRYIYTDHLDISRDNAVDLLGGAVYFQMKSAIKWCTQVIVNNLDTENWFDVLMLFKSYALLYAVGEVEAYIREHITDIAKADNNTKLPYANFCFLVQNWQSSEYDLCLFILKWVKAEQEEREQYVDELLCSVRYSLMTTQQLSAIAAMKDLGGISVDSLIDMALEYHKLPLHQRVLEDSEQSKVRSPPSFVNIVDTHYNEGTIGYFYDPLIEKSFIEHKGLTLPTQVRYAVPKMVVNNFLIVHDTSSNQQIKFHIFDPRMMKWERMADLQRDRIRTTLVHDNKYLYVIGGLEPPTTILDSIVRYDFQTNSWSQFDSLPVPLRFAGVCVYNNSLYVSGGVAGGQIPAILEFDEVDNADVQTAVYRLDLSTHEWETKAPLCAPEYGHEMHVMKILGEDHLCIIDSEYNMKVCCLTRDFWGYIGFTFAGQLLRFEGRGNVSRWFWGNSVYTIDYENDTGDVKYYQKITIPEHGWDGYVEHCEYYGGHRISGLRHVLAIPPYTSEPEF